MTNASAEPGALPVLVTGGTGVLGRVVVERLRGLGCDVRVLSRHRPPSGEAIGGVVYVEADLDHDGGVHEAVRGTGTIIHCAGSAKGDDIKARHLVKAAVAAGSPHIVFISVVGADRITVASRTDRAMFGYFSRKLAAEGTIAKSGVPWTTLRASQFHQLTWATARQMSRMPVVTVPSGFRIQPVDAGEVAERLVELALGAPSGLVAEMAGPRTYPMKSLVRDYLRANRRHRLVMSIRLPGRAAGAFRAGGNLSSDGTVGRHTWEAFVADRTPVGRRDVATA